MRVPRARHGRRALLGVPGRSPRRGLPGALGALGVALASVEAFAASPAWRATWPANPRERQAAIAADPDGTARRVDSLLAFLEPRDPSDHAFLLAIAEDYLAAHADSLLLWDTARVWPLDRARRADWWSAVQLDAEAFALRSRREFEDSAAKFAAAAELYGSVGDLRRRAVALGSRGVSLWYTGDFARVETAYREALEARLQLGDPVLIGRTQNALGSVALRRSDLQAARAWYAQARRTREPLGRPNDLATTLAYLGNVDYKRGDLEGARRAYFEALETFDEHATARQLNVARMGLANVHHSLGEYARAIALYREARDLALARGDARSVVLNRKNMAGSLMAAGDLAAALHELELAAAMQDSLGDRFDAAATWNALGSVFERLGQTPRALRAYRTAEARSREAENPRELANATGGLGFVYFRMGLPERALAHYARAESLRVALGDSLGLAPILAKRADVHLAQGDADGAVRLYRRAQELDASLGARMRAAQRALDLGNALNAGAARSPARAREAARSFRAAAASSRELDQPGILWAAYLGLGDLFERRGLLDSARVWNGRAMDAVEALDAARLADADKTRFLARRSLVYEAQLQVLAALHARDGDDAWAREAFAVAERGRARALLDRLARADDRAPTHLPRDLRDAIAANARALTAIHYRLRRAAETAAPRDTVRAWRKRLQQLEDHRRRLRARAHFEDPRRAALVGGEPVALDTLQRELLGSGRAVLLEYAVGDSVSLGWVVTRNHVTMFRLPGRDLLEKATRRLRSALADPSPDGDALLLDTSARLAALLLEPAREAIRTHRTVLVIPDDALLQVPFECLLDPRRKPAALPAAGAERNQALRQLRYLLDDSDVVYGPSATTLLHLQRPRPRAAAPPMQLLAVGDPWFGPSTQPTRATVRGGVQSELAPLPFTRREVETIASRVRPEERTVLLGESADEARLRQPGFLARYRILHFATHGIVDVRHPERSALALSLPDDPSEDGMLQAAEIHDLRLVADLVVLSACETGLGRTVRGEGVLGLPRAFLYAGASAVIVSLWSVSDQSTARFMDALYTDLFDRGSRPATALRHARRVLREYGDDAHPFHWGAFVLVGTATPGEGRTR